MQMVENDTLTKETDVEMAQIATKPQMLCRHFRLTTTAFGFVIPLSNFQLHATFSVRCSVM